jgi:uncharacterized membrane protein
MANPSGMMVAALYESEDRAMVVLDMIHQMSSAETIKIIDAAALVKDVNGKIHVHETKELTVAKGSRRGALVAGIVGAIFPPAFVASTVVGGGIGALIGKMRDTGIPNSDIEEIASHIENGKAAVLVLAEEPWVADVENALKGDEATLIRQPIDDETLKQLYLAHPEKHQSHEATT